MISFKKYLGIIVMMMVLFVIFLFSVIINEEGSFYDINEYAVEQRPSGEFRWEASEADELVVLIGAETTALVDVVTQWCHYTKRELMVMEQLDGYLETATQNARKPVMILLDAAEVEFGAGYQNLVSLTELGIPLVFCGMPSKDAIASGGILREILGIRAVMPQSAEVTGVQLYDGFFLGGEVVYKAETEEERKRQDMNLTVPWYLLQSGTKSYMVGTMEEDKVRQNIGLSEEAEGVTGYLPKLIWRNSYKNCMVFVVNGEYMSTLAGLGILNSFCYEMKEYEVYPVVNAQNVLIQNYPDFSGENEAKLLQIYSRSPKMVFQGIMWPSVSAMAKANGLKLTCFFNPQYQYGDLFYPDGEEVPFYLKQLREINSEAGMALSYGETTSFATMLYEDTKFYRSLNRDYCYQTVFAEEKDLEAVQKNLGEDNLLQNVVTVGCRYQEGESLISYVTDEVTLQRTTGIAEQHSYMDDFIVRGIETALMYSNVLVDLQNAVWPQEEEDEWQNLYDEMASNVSTYWAAYREYEQTTLSESDLRVRALLNLEYDHERTADTIRLQVNHVEAESYFLLRTHDEKISAITGGEYQKLENNAYLIKAVDTVVEVKLEPMSLKEQREK